MYYDASLFENALFTVVEAYNKAIDACYLRRKEIVQELKKAREIGDLYDNPAYDAAREKQQINELRVSCYRSLEQVVNMFRDIEENSPDELDSKREYSVHISQRVDSAGNLLEEHYVGESLDHTKCINEHRTFTPDGKILTVTNTLDNWFLQTTYHYDETGRCITHEDVTRENHDITNITHANYSYSEDGRLFSIKYYENEALTGEKLYQYDSDMETIFIYKKGRLNAINFTTRHGSYIVKGVLNSNHEVEQFRILFDQFDHPLLTYNKGDYQILTIATLDDKNRLTDCEVDIYYKSYFSEYVSFKNIYETIVRS